VKKMRYCAKHKIHYDAKSYCAKCFSEIEDKISSIFPFYHNGQTGHKSELANKKRVKNMKNNQ